MFGQFAVGLLLGAVWSPCVGPTLGAASVLAAQARDIERVIVTMVLFGLGAALPLLILGVVSREALMLWRGHLAGLGAGMKAALGVTLMLTAMAIFFGIDRSIETALVNSSPEWLTDLTTRY